MGWWIMGTKHLGVPDDPVCTCRCEGCSHTGHCCCDWTGCKILDNYDDDGLREIYTGPMDDTTVGFVLAYGEHAGEIVYDTVKAGALAFNQNVPLVSGNPTVGHRFAWLGALADMLHRLGVK